MYIYLCSYSVWYLRRVIYQIFDFQPGDYFYQDLETYGWDWYRELNLPEAPQKRYYSKFKVGSKEGDGYLVEDLDIPSDRVHKAVKWLASDFLRFANKEIPDGGQRISRDLVVTHKVRLPATEINILFSQLL